MNPRAVPHEPSAETVRREAMAVHARERTPATDTLQRASWPRPPSIQGKLGRTLMLWSIGSGLAVGAAIWSIAAHEVDELLDDALQSSADLVAAHVMASLPALDAARDARMPEAVREVRSAEVARDAREPTTEPAVRRPTAPTTMGRTTTYFAWQVTASDGSVVLRSPLAPAQAWHPSARVGFSDTPEWRLFGQALADGGRMLYVAQSADERREARTEVGLGTVLVALGFSLLGLVWLRSRVRAELRPLDDLADRLTTLELDGPAGSAATLGVATLGPPARKELEPMHAALDALAQRLATRLANEQAFSAHAAHALRTPLAGIDAQLSVAMRESSPEVAQRLLGVRAATARLQTVVVALLGLFRSGMEVHRTSVDVAALVARIPVPGVITSVESGLRVAADADLLAAALMNLIDNAQRHGARHVGIDALLPRRGDDGVVHAIRVRDDGRGQNAERCAALNAVLDGEAYSSGALGLGLMLADRVARTHGGRARIVAIEGGFEVELRLAPDAAPSNGVTD